MAIGTPQLTRNPQGHRRQEHKAIFVALGVADVNLATLTVDVGAFQRSVSPRRRPKLVGDEPEASQVESARDVNDAGDCILGQDIG